VSLIRVGLAEQERASGRYRLGPLALELGLAALRADNLLGVAGEVLADLRDEIDETVMLAVWGNKGPVVVRWEESSRPVATNVRAGWVMPVANSATGRCFAAFLAEGLVAPLLDLTPRERAAFHARLTEIRARGMSRVDGDLLSGVSAIAAPVFQHDGAIAAVIASLGPQRAFDIAWRGGNAIATRAAALRLSKRLGHPVAAAPQR
jgi:DNA-binding IclR family transcriptional regulator